MHGRWMRFAGLSLGALTVWTFSACNELTGVNDLVVASAMGGGGSSGGAGAAGQSGLGGASGTAGLGAGDDAGAGASAGAGNGGSSMNPDVEACGPGVPGLCDPVSDCGCDTSVETCSAEISGDRLCRRLPSSPTPAYGLCDDDGDCPARHSCIAGSCKQHCRDVSDCGWSLAECRSVVAPDQTPIPNWSFCTRNCDIVSPANPDPGYQACGPGVQCLVTGNGTDCIYADSTTPAGGLCIFNEDCIPGTLCLEAVPGSGARCTPICEIDGDDCAEGQCIPMTPPVNVLGRTLGRCCNVPPGQACDLVTDCGCPSGQTCVADAAGTRSCRVLGAAPVAPYTECFDDLDCPALHSCVNGACSRHCNTPADCGWPGAQCLQIFINDTPIPGWSSCTRNCDLASPAAPAIDHAACGPDTQCVISGDPPFSDCAGLHGGGVEGEACEEDLDCSPGLYCDLSVLLCTRWCAVGATCPGGAACVGVMPPFVVNNRELSGCFDQVP